mmetsp:Transcript_78832/g.157545  ORF Transcript_78832/g.157545 Transcript_78832/m.157545 type:complete len:299 (-) Transcript_78832:280-1176(-)
MEPLVQNCNGCWRPVSGTICKTSCHHLFCEECAVNHFTHYNNCPTCNECLDTDKEGTFQELLVGVAPNPLIDSLYQNAYSDPEHSAIGHQILWALNGCREMLTTHLTQLGLEINRHQSSATAVETRRVQESKISSELKQRCANLEHKMQEMERRNTRLERSNSELQAKAEQAAQTAESYRAHYLQMKSKGPAGGSSNGGTLLPPSMTQLARPNSSNDVLRIANFRSSHQATPRRMSGQFQATGTGAGPLSRGVGGMLLAPPGSKPLSRGRSQSPTSATPSTQFRPSSTGGFFRQGGGL